MKNFKKFVVAGAVILAVSAGSFTALAAANPDKTTGNLSGYSYGQQVRNDDSTGTQAAGIQTQDQEALCSSGCTGTMMQQRNGATNRPENAGHGGAGVESGYGYGYGDGTGTGICDGSGQHGAGVCDGTGTRARDGSCQN